MSDPEIIPPPDARAHRLDDPLSGLKAEVPYEVVETAASRRPRLRYAHGLDPMEARFAARYLQHGDAFRAMREAGWPKPTHKGAADLLADQRIAAVIEEQLDAVADLYRATRHRIVAEHARIAFSNLADFEDVLTRTGDDAVEAFNTLPRGVRASVRKMKVTRRYEGKGEDKQPVDTLEIEMHDKQRSLDVLAKVTKLNDEPDDDEVLSGFAAMLRAAARKAGVE